MNMYLIALIGLVVLLVVGFFFYGVFFKQVLKGNEAAMTPTRWLTMAVGMYLVSLAFTRLYKDATVFASGTDGALKGFYLGVFVGVAFWALPFFMDGEYVNKDKSRAWAVLLNWVVSFALLGLVVGSLV